MTAGTHYSVRPLEDFERPLWDELVRRSPQGTLFHSSLWLQSTGEPFRLYGCFRGKELRAGAAVGLVAPKTAGHPVGALTPYLGLLLPPPAQKRVTTQSTNKELSAAIALALLQEFSTIYLRFSPEIVDLQPFIWEGYEPGIRYTYRLELDDLALVLANMDATRRRNIRTAEEDGLYIDENAPFEQILELSGKSFRRQGKTADFLVKAERICRSLEAACQCRSFIARAPNGQPIGGVWIVWDQRRAYYLIGGYDEEAQRADAVPLAMWAAIRYTANELKLREFDFEGSMVPAIERFFRKFGGELLPTYTVSHYPKGIAQRSQEWLRRRLASAGLA